MDVVLDFITNNPIVVIIVAVVLVIALVGYMFDKKFSKKEKNVVESDSVEPTVVEQNVNNNATVEQTPSQPTIDHDYTSKISDIHDDVVHPAHVDSIQHNTQHLSFDGVETDVIETPVGHELSENNSNVEQSIGEVETIQEQPVLEEISTEISQPIVQDFNDSVVEELSVEPVVQEVAVEQPASLPNIDTLASNTIDDSEEDDVWKF